MRIMNSNRLVISGAFCLATSLAVGTFAQTSSQSTPNAQKPAAAERATPSAASASSPDRVVMKVGDEQISQGELDSIIAALSPQVKQVIARQGRRPIGDQYAMMILLSNRAVSDHLDSNPAVSRELNLQRLQILAQAEYQNIADQIKVTPEEISDYYKAHSSDFDEVQIRQFAVRKKAAGGSASDPGLTDADAKSKINAIRSAVASGTDIAKVAQEFAKPNVILIDTAPRPVRHGQLLPDIEKAAFSLKDGQVTDVVDTPQAAVFAQVVGHQHQDLKDVSKEIENTLRQDKLQADMNALKQSSKVWMDDDYFKAPASETPGSGDEKPDSGNPKPPAPASEAPHPAPPKH